MRIFLALLLMATLASASEDDWDKPDTPAERARMDYANEHEDYRGISRADLRDNAKVDATDYFIDHEKDKSLRKLENCLAVGLRKGKNHNLTGGELAAYRDDFGLKLNALATDPEESKKPITE